MRKWAAAATLAVLALALAPACQEATSVRLVLQTNVLPSDQISIAVFAGATEDVESAPPSVVVRGTAWETKQRIGSLTFVPRSDDAGTLTIRVALARGREASECSIASAAGCVIARRRIAFLPHQSLVLPITLFEQCEDVPCSAKTTCNVSRECVLAALSPAACASASGCLLPGDPAIDAPVAAASGQASRDAATDGSTSSDAASYASDGAPDASDAGDAATQYASGADVPCYAAGTCQGGTPVCCHAAGGNATCVARGASCPQSQFRMACDNHLDCVSGSSCCRLETGMADLVCLSTLSCFGVAGTLVCTPATATEDCSAAATSMCTSRTYWNECGP